jgi:hypothetical protein
MLGAVAAKVLLILHAAAAIALVGATVHYGILAVSYLRGRYYRIDLHRTYLKIICYLYPLTFALGLILYPRFRVHVRADYMDKEAPYGTLFFEIKEHWLAVGLAILIALLALSRNIQISKPTAVTHLYNMLGIVLTVVVLFAVFTGLVLVSVRSV